VSVDNGTEALRNSNLTQQVAAYARSTQFSGLPADTVDYCKRVILDTLGCMVLGGTMDSGRIMRAYLESMGGSGEAFVIGTGRRFPATLAALANGTAAHADELDAVHLVGGHMPAVAVATAMAASELAQLGGTELINGVVLLFDVGCGLLEAVGGRSALERTQHIHSSSVFALGASVAASRLLGLPQLPMQHAMALSAHQVAAPLAFMEERNHMSKAMTHGQAAYAGVAGAVLASRGFEAADRILEAEHGLIDMWWSDQVSLERLTDYLGSYSIVKTGFKYFSAGYPIHGPLSAALRLVSANRIALDDITQIRIGMTKWNADRVDSRAMASICIQDMMGVGLTLGRLTYEDVHESAAGLDPAAGRIRDIVQIVRDRDLDAGPPDMRHASWLEIHTSNGSSYKESGVLPPGNWQAGGMPWADLEKKFAQIVSPRVGPRASDRVIELAQDLEYVDDVGDLGRALAI
jgi:2-methylcitrate dehydratase PrpD